MINILFNLAALYSQLALSSNRSTSDGLKNAYNYFCQAAGVVNYIKLNCLPELRTSPPEDMDQVALESVEKLMLAQAQESFWQKAVKDGLKDTSIAKLAAMVSDFYGQAADWAIKSDAISSEWIHHMNAKHHHFAAAAQYRASCDCLEKRKYGEEVARLRDGLLCVNEALKESRYINKAVQADLDGLKNKIQDDLKRAEKDNDLIYLSPVPSKAELRPLDRSTMAISQTPKEVSQAMDILTQATGGLGKPLFAQLIPYTIHLAANIYNDRRNKLIQDEIITKLNDLTVQIHDKLASLNLPGSLQAIEKPLGLPTQLANNAAEFRQLGGTTQLSTVMHDSTKLKEAATAIYLDGVTLLEAESAADASSRKKFGTASWTRDDSPTALAEIYKRRADIETYLSHAAGSDLQLANQYQRFEPFFVVLGGSDRDIEDFIPSSVRRVVVSPGVDRASSALRNVLDRLLRAEKARAKAINDLTGSANAEDIYPILIDMAEKCTVESPTLNLTTDVFEQVFVDNLAKYYDYAEREIPLEQSLQQGLLEEVERANLVFISAQSDVRDVSIKDREEKLQNLDKAYNVFKEMRQNLEKGRKFYNDLIGVVTRFREDCKIATDDRRQQSSRLQGDIVSKFAQINISTLNQGL